MNREQIVEAITQLNVLELSDLVKDLEEKFGVKAQTQFAFSPQMMSPDAGAGVEEKAPEQTTFNVILSVVGDKKINVVKVVREITKLGLKEAKDLVEAAPKPIKEGITREEAEKIKSMIEEAGATVEIK